MADQEECNTGLGLGLSVGRYYLPKGESQKDSPPPPCLDLSVALCPEEGAPKVDSLSPRTIEEEEEEEEEEDKKRDCKNNSKNISGRKKLRLTKEQSSLLENSFKLHTTLNPAKKQALAEQLNLKPRQVEVWFQNRRARTKLKQTEVDCEFLKKCCESLSEENRRLKKELQELRSLKVAAPPPLFIQIPKATTLSMCPSCEKIEGKPDVVLKNNK